MPHLARLLAKAAVCLACLSGAVLAPAQTCSIPGQAGTITLAAQPNTFFPGSASAAAGATSISVGAGTGLSSPIQAGDLLLIIQMQGADINSTDTNAYGDGGASAGITTTVAFGAAGYAGGTTAMTAGTYEWAVATTSVTYGAGGTVGLSRGLVNAYATQAGSSTQAKRAWQVVRVPQYANVTLSAGLTVQPWNGSTGGILAIDAAGTLNLAGQTINGNGAGFRGAGVVNTTPQCTATPNPVGCPGYRALISTTLGGSKGEGLAGTPGRLYNNDPGGTGGGTIVAGAADGYVDGDLMRGAPGNAGGGGNQHNAGGGGGGNGGAGGNGGNSWNNSQVAYAGSRVGGFGGAPTGNSATRWVMGGGGGAGDIGGNTSTNPDGAGGAGGGLVILRASQVVGGGASINVNGAPGQRARATDAAGGGGAGGTVVIAAGTGGLNGALTINANGGAGGSYQVAVDEQDGAGGGGGGGVLITNVAGFTFNAAGGAAGGSSSNACPPTRPAANCGQAAGSATGGSTGYAITSPGVQVGYECLPSLTVVKSTTTPLVTSATGATAGYVITVTNTGGGARFVELYDWNLPPGWTLAPGGSVQYQPAQPVAAGNLASGAETVAKSTSSTWSVGAAPLAVPATGANQLSVSSFAVAPITNGVPGAMTFTFVASIPDTATVGTYHNGMGLSFLDPTRPAASTRTVAPLAGVNANRTAVAYSANTTYANYNGAAATSVGGANYSGLSTGPIGEDVRLLPDFSITKTASASAALGATFTYTLTPRNNGRAIAAQGFASTQATTVTTANIGATLGSSPLTVTDTLPAGITMTTPFTGTNWTCSAVTATTPVCTRTDAQAYPIAAATSYPAITGTAMVTCSTSTARTNTATISTGAGETLTANNVATAATASPLCANLSVTKTNATTTVAAGSTTSYTVTIANLGPTAAPGTVVVDPAVPGLNCTAIACSTTGTASCPAPLTIAALQSTGLVITPDFASGSTVSLRITCGVTATGH